MRMAGQLQRHAGLCMLRSPFGAMGQENHGHPRFEPFQGGPQIGTQLAKRPSLPVRRTGHCQRRIAAPDDDMGIFQHVQAQRPIGMHPAQIVGIVFMVAGDRQHTVTGLQIVQRLDIGCPCRGSAVRQVPRDHDQIRIQGIGLGHDRCHPGLFQQTTGMQIGQLHDAVAIKGLRQSRQRQFQVLDVRYPDCLPGAEGGQHQGQDPKRQVQRPAGQDRPARAARQQPSQPAHHVAQQQEQGQQQHHPERPAHADEYAPRQFRRRQRAKEPGHEPVIFGRQQGDQRQYDLRPDAT